MMNQSVGLSADAMDVYNWSGEEEEEEEEKEEEEKEEEEKEEEEEERSHSFILVSHRFHFIMWKWWKDSFSEFIPLNPSASV